MRRIGPLIVIILLIICSGNAQAESLSGEIIDAVVRIHATVPQHSPSTSSLGTEREGNGVAIDSEGTILTVGYLVREAEAIEVTDQSGKTVSARLVSYDYDTG